MEELTNNQHSQQPKLSFQEEVEKYTPHADAGEVWAIYNLGQAYFEEAERRQFKQLMKQSYQYFKMAADAGDIEPYAHLGIMASDGMGTRKNDADAKFYLEKYLQERGNDELTPAVDPCYYYPRRWRVPLLVILTCIYAAFLFFVSTIPTDGSMAFSS